MFVLEILVAAVLFHDSAAASWLSSSESCYLPNGTLEPSLKACFTKGGHSSCCYDKTACSGSGYCYGSAGVIYRGGCTDKSWESGKCSQQCSDVFQDTFSNILVVPGKSGIDLDIHCAGPSSCPAGACDEKVVIQDLIKARDEPSPVSAFVSTGIATSRTIVTATVIPNPSAVSGSIEAPTASGGVPNTTSLVITSGQISHGPASAKTVGLAVGIPLGLLALAASLGCLYLWRKLRLVSSSNRSTAFKNMEDDNLSIVETHPPIKEPPPNYEKGKVALQL